MSRFIDLIETFDFTNLTFQSYDKKIDGLLERFPKYERDDRFRTVLPNKFLKTADDYVSIKFCTRGRYPVYGIYKRRDFDFVGVCVQGNIMYALDDCDLHPSSVPDVKVRNVHLGIQYTPLATRETLNHTKKCLCSAISTVSLGYTPQKKNEWCEAIVLLTGMTTQALRFRDMKAHVRRGLLFTTAHGWSTFNGRYALLSSQMAMQNRWNKISKAIRGGEYPYVYSYYEDHGPYGTSAKSEYSAGDVLLINDRDKTNREKPSRRIVRWNGPLGNSQRKREEESHRRQFMEIEAKRIMKEMDNNSSERMHGFWCGSVDTFEYEVASVNRLPRPAQIVGNKRFLVSATSHLARLKDLLQAQRTLGSIPLAVQNIWNEGTTTILEKWGFNLEGPDSNFLVRRPRLNPLLGAAIHRAIVDYTCPVFSGAAAFYLCAKRREVKVDKIRLRSDFNRVSTSMKDMCFGHFGTSKEKVDPKKVKWNREPRPFVLPGRGRSLGALGATFVCPLQVITTRCMLNILIRRLDILEYRIYLREPSSSRP